MLKAPANKGLRERYLAAARPAARLAILAQVDQLPLPSLRVLVPLLLKGPVAPRIEWFFSVRQLCGLMARVQQLPQMSINPGVADPAGRVHVHDVRHVDDLHGGFPRRCARLVCSQGADYRSSA